MLIKVLIVDDEPAVRHGLRMSLALENDLVVVGEAGDGLEAVEAAKRLRPDAIIMDAALPLMDGISAARALRGELPDCAVVILTLHDNAAIRAEAREAGADFVAKHSGAEGLLKSIRRLRPTPEPGWRLTH